MPPVVLEAHKLVRVQSMAVQMQRVHAELKAGVWGAWGQHLTEPAAPVPAPSVTRLLEMWDYEASLLMQVTTALILITIMSHEQRQCW